MTYTIGDFLIQVKNAYMAKHKTLIYAYSRVVVAIGKILEKEGYIKKLSEKEEGGKKRVVVELLYKKRKPVLQNIRLVSKPSAHIYSNVRLINTREKGLGITIVSTNKGVMTGEQAKKEGVGGEVICEVV